MGFMRGRFLLVMTKASDLLGRTFERLLVVSRADSTEDGRSRWFCRCVCGKSVIVTGKLLKAGKVRSCGCLRRDALSVVAAAK